MSKLGPLTLGLVLLCGGTARAAEGDSFSSYDSIVNELKSDAEVELKPRHEAMDWDSVALSGSLGFTGALVDVPGAGAGVLKGFEAALGTNLFSKRARAEFAFRNYAGEELSKSGHVDMREFEARAVFLPPLGEDTRVRMGLGLNERMLNVTGKDGVAIDRSGLYYSLLVGLEHQVSRAVSFGPDVAYRASVAERADRRSSWDATVRLNANF